MQKFFRRFDLLALSLILSMSCYQSFAEELEITFSGVWRDAFGNEYVSDLLYPLIGTSFSGLIRIPTADNDLEPAPNDLRYEFLSTEGTFELDAAGTDFDVSSTSTVHVRVLNDGSAEQLYGGPPSPPFYDFFSILTNVNGYQIYWSAIIKRGNPPTAFDSENVPTPSEILATASIEVGYYPLSFNASENIFLVATEPLANLVPPNSIPDSLDVSIAVIDPAAIKQVPIPLASLIAFSGIIMLLSMNASRFDFYHCHADKFRHRT